MTYALILIVLNLGGGSSSFVVDFDLSQSDCSMLQAQWSETVDQYSTVICEGN